MDTIFKIDQLLYDDDKDEDPDKIAKGLSLYIHQVIPEMFSWIPLLLISGVYVYLLDDIRKHRFNPRISSRQPRLLFIITLASYIDVCCKLGILSLSYTLVDIKCLLAIQKRMFFHYVMYIFMIKRIWVVHRVTKLQNQLYEQQKQNNLSQQSKNDILEEAEIYSEARVGVDTFVNSLIPLIFVGLLATFIPYALVLTPIVEKDLCWFYYVTRSPYQMGTIPVFLYWTQYVFRFIVTLAEMGLIITVAYNLKKMRKSKADLQSIPDE